MRPHLQRAPSGRGRRETPIQEGHIQIVPKETLTWPRPSSPGVCTPRGGNLRQQDWRGRPAFSSGRAIGLPVMVPRPPTPGPGRLPLLRTAPGLCCAAAPALVGDCGKMPLSWQLSGPGGAGARDGMEEASLPSLCVRSLPPSLPWAGHHAGVQCIPHCQGHPL